MKNQEIRMLYLKFGIVICAMFAIAAIAILFLSL